MNKRLKFHEILVETLESENVYFQPPQTVKMQYPCIVYSRSDLSTNYADGILYKFKKGYTVTVIDSNPDSIIPDKIKQLPYSRFNRHFTINNMNHDVFTIYY